MGLKEYLFGKNSEDTACEYLQKSGFDIKERNFNSRFGEIDIIAKKESVLHFIEVKATSKEYEAIYRLTPTKFQKILKAIDFYMLKNGLNNDFQIDLIVIEKDRVKLIENISL